MKEVMEFKIHIWSMELTRWSNGIGYGSLPYDARVPGFKSKSYVCRLLVLLGQDLRFGFVRSRVQNTDEYGSAYDVVLMSIWWHRLLSHNTLGVRMVSFWCQCDDPRLLSHHTLGACAYGVILMSILAPCMYCAKLLSANIYIKTRLTSDHCT